MPPINDQKPMHNLAIFYRIEHLIDELIVDLDKGKYGIDFEEQRHLTEAIAVFRERCQFLYGEEPIAPITEGLPTRCVDMGGTIKECAEKDFAPY